MKAAIAFSSFFVLTLFFACESADSSAEQAALPDDGTAELVDENLRPFYHNVASGDPLTDRVIIWTRVTPPKPQAVEGQWVVASDAEMQNVVQEGTFTTNADRDYTVKIDVTGLAPNTRYYYQFLALEGKSPIGRTKTAPADTVDEVAFAVVSCSNYEQGYFNAFEKIAEKDELSAVIHLGDYIYEYGPGTYGDTTLGRKHLPPHEIIELSDYRTRYALYRLDEDFQKAHQIHPFITIWDDHEITNNAYIDGAQNHQPEEGDYMQRKAAARQAYYEWLPVREDDETLYRKLDFGNLVDLIMLDERIAGRTKQADSLSQADYTSPERTMLGEEQLAWFKEQLANSDAVWKVIGNQVIFSDVDFSPINNSRNLDAWDGYPAEKDSIINFFQKNDIENIVFITGDTHSSWAFEVPTSIEDYKSDSTSTVAVEFGTTSVTSANYGHYTTLDTVEMAQNRLLDPAYNPQMKFTNLHDHGYLLLTLTPEQVRADWYYIETIEQPTSEEFIGKTFVVEKDTEELVSGKIGM